MKSKIFRLLFIIIAIVGTTSCNSDDDAYEVTISYKELPPASRNLLETYFPGIETRRIIFKGYPNDDGTLYEVKLRNGFEFDFDEDGEWTEIDGDGKSIPDALLPEFIVIYVQQNYPAHIFIEAMDKKSSGYIVELSNEEELKFNREGEFLARGGVGLF